jgi:hypothetical protein
MLILESQFPTFPSFFINDGGGKDGDGGGGLTAEIGLRERRRRGVEREKTPVFGVRTVGVSPVRESCCERVDSVESRTSHCCFLFDVQI